MPPAIGADARMRKLTAAALNDADVQVTHMARCVRFDSEEQCRPCATRGRCIRPSLKD